MREFFRGWRRKVGCATLVMACVAGAAWSRSYLYSEYIGIGTTNRIDVFLSSQGLVRWAAIKPPPGDRWFWWGSNDTVGLFALMPYDPSMFEPSWPGPYCVIVIPLTLISAYLILWKPRPKVERDA